MSKPKRLAASKSLSVHNGEIAHHNIRPLEVNKDCNWLSALQNEAFSFFPGKEEWRQRLIYTMNHWLRGKEDALCFEEFCWDYHIPITTFLFWVKKYEDIALAYTELKRVLGMRRKKGTMLGDYVIAATYRDMHIYDPEWGTQVDKYHADLKKESDASAPVTVIIEKAPSSNKVKEKKGSS